MIKMIYGFSTDQHLNPAAASTIFIIAKINIMKTDQILKADILDIIFEHRNKDYGAYALRRHYSERVYKALGIIFIVALIVGSISFLYKDKISTELGKAGEVILCTLTDIQDNQAIIPEPPKPHKTNTTTPATAPIINQVPVIDDNSTPINDPAENNNNTAPEGSGGDGPGDEHDNNGIGNNPSIMPPAIPEPPKPVDKTTPVLNPEVQPSFPGGIEALRKFLKKNLLPPKEVESDEIISVTVQFVVGYDGILKSFVIVEDGGEEFNNEVIRVIKKMPAWIPGKSHGENVSVYYSIPVKFTPTD